MINAMNGSYFGPIVSAIKYFMMHYIQGVPAPQLGVYDLVLEPDEFLTMSVRLDKNRDRYGLLKLPVNSAVFRKITSISFRCQFL